MSCHWTKCSEGLPSPYLEVLVWIDGKRGPLWRNNYALVAYITQNGEWYEERHHSKFPLVGVCQWAHIDIPE